MVYQIRQVQKHLINQAFEPKTQTYHTRVGSERPAERPSGVVQDCMSTELFAQKTKSTILPNASKKRPFHVSLEARTSEIPCKPTEGQNQLLTRGFSPVYHWFINGLSAGREALFVFGCRPVYRCLFVSVNFFHARHVRENSNKSRAGRFGAAHGRAAGLGRAG